MKYRGDSEKELYNARLHYFAIVTSIAATLLIIAGALVTSTGSGDSVPDWPLAYGSLTPPMVGGIVFEYSHRLIAGMTATLVGILAIWLWFSRPRRKIRWLGLAAFLAVLAQAVLGGLRVMVVSNEAVRQFVGFFIGSMNFDSYRLFFATAHGILGQTVLFLLFSITLFLSESWIKSQQNGKEIRLAPGARGMSVLLFGAVFIQLFLGTLIRHADASLVIPDFPLAFGRIIPPFGNLPLPGGDISPAMASDFAFRVALQFSHRMMALIILGLAVYFFVTYRKTFRIGNIVKILFGLVLIQVTLGAFNIWAEIPVYTTVPHVAVGALILASSVVLTLWVWRFRREAVAIPYPSKKTPVKEAEPVAAG